MQTSAAFLRANNLTPSPQRVAIYDFLRKNAVHPTVDTIYQAVINELPTISRTTVYNTVKRLAAAGLIQEVIIEDGELRYDADISSHGHFKCLECGEVYDLFPPPGESIVKEVQGLPEGFEIHQLHLCCRGICRKCNKQ